MGPAVLDGLRRGIEKESLRVRRDGTLALTPHPPALGSPLTHPHITTDFSESQLELITGVHASIDSCVEELTHVHQFVCSNIGDEVLWAGSMPCHLPPEDDIPIARYGRSNVARSKSVYRMGLAHRYGRRMQMISGIHYNFSLPVEGWGVLKREPNEAYFALIRNFRRHSWLLLYLLGASPAVCCDFLEGRPHQLQALSADTLYAPYATSLRMGRLGYQSDAQAALAVSYNSLEQYAASLERALTQPWPAYETIGVRGGENYRQLTTSLLQIENEFYGTIRPKRRIRSGERPLHALRERGVEYVEVRLIDLDPYSPIGITADTMRVIDLFLLHSLLSDSAPDTPNEIEAIAANQHAVAERGREPRLKLRRGHELVELAAWGTQLLEACEPIAHALDAPVNRGYTAVLASAIGALHDAERVPSARMLDEILRQHHRSYPQFALAKSLEHARTLETLPFPREIRAHYERLAQESLEKQSAIEAADTVPFETYRQRYLAPESLKA
jgi:glutamate--cysteine ligase